MRYRWKVQIGNHWIAGTDTDIDLSFDPRPVLGIAIQQKGPSAAVMARNKLTLGGIPCITDGKLRPDLLGMPEPTPTYF